MTHYQISSSEPRGIVGSRAAKATTEAEAREEVKAYSRYRSIKKAWLREWPDGQRLPGPVIATFQKGKEIPND